MASRVIPNTACVSMLAIASATFLGCGSGASSAPPAEPVARAQAAPVDPTPHVRTYVAPLTPLNDQIQGRRVSGLAAFSVDDREGTVRTLVTANNLSGKVATRVYVQGESEDATCPTIDADANGDDVIDADEAASYAGREALPLAPGQTDVTRLEDPEFRTGVVVVYGLGTEAEGEALDDSLREAPLAAVPIACGEVTRIN